MAKTKAKWINSESATDKQNLEADGASGAAWRSHAVGTTVVTITSVDSPYTISTADTVLSNGAGGAITVNLPTAVGISGRVLLIKRINSGANKTTVDGNGAQTIDGAATVDLTKQYETLMIQSDGSNWMII